MGTRKLFFYNITSIDFDARGRLHASSSVIINTKGAEHIQLKFITMDDFDLMNNAFESYLEKTHNPQQYIAHQNVSTTSDADELLKYAELYEKGLLTKEEFEMKKAEILGNPITGPSETQTHDENYSLKQEFAQENDLIIEDKPKFCPNCGTSILMKTQNSVQIAVTSYRYDNISSKSVILF
jgi:DNA-directed RNA polymerase subunit RPC12/RpoP